MLQCALCQNGEIAGLRLLQELPIRKVYELTSRKDGQPLVLVRHDHELNNALNVFWSSRLLGVRNDVVAFGGDIEEYLPNYLWRSETLQKTATVKFRLSGEPVRCMVRCLPGHSALFMEILGNGRERQYRPATFCEGFLVTHAIELLRVASAIAASRGVSLTEVHLEFSRTEDGKLVWSGEKFTRETAFYAEPLSLDSPSSEFFDKLVGKSIEAFQSEDMGIVPFN